MINETVLYVTNFVSLVLFLTSEMLSMSSCEYNGVFQFATGSCVCSGHKEKIYVGTNRENVV